MLRALFLILFILNFAILAQSDKPQAFKYGEFEELPEQEWKDRLDKFAESQVSIPKSTLVIVVYAKLGTERRSIDAPIKKFEDYLEKSKQIKSVYIQPGGFRKAQTTELWIVPDKAEFPNPTPDEDFKAEKFAEIGDIDKKAFEDRLNEFFRELYEESYSQGYIINYGTPEQIKKREEFIRDSIDFRSMCNGSRFVFVNGGDKGKPETVLWVVPAGAKPPMR